MSSDIWNLNTLCRCCHADGYFTSLNLAHQDQDGVEFVYEVMLKETLGITIYVPPLDASYSICNQCITKLVDAYNFRTQVLKNEEKFTIYCTNEQFIRGPDVKIEEDKHESDSDYDYDSYSETSGTLSQDLKEDTYSEISENWSQDSKKDNHSEFSENLSQDFKGDNHSEFSENLSQDFKGDNHSEISDHLSQDVKREITIEVDIQNPIKQVKQEGSDKEEKTEIPTESIKVEKNLSNRKKSTTPGKRRFPRIDRSLIVQLDRENGVQYSCKTCGGCYQTEIEITQHIHKQHSTPYKCELCSKLLKTFAILKRHMKVHSEKEHKCPYCERRFINRYMFDAHVNTHTNEKKYICDLCKKEFKYKQSLRTHFQYHAGTLKKYLCELCGHSFNDRTNLKIHINTVHEKQRPFICAMCDKTYSTKNHLRKHIIAFHNKIVEDKEKYRCTICGRPMACQKTLNYHMVRHDNKFMCKFCKLIFNDKLSWSEHVQSAHSGNHPCHLCTKTFYSKHSLNRHIDSHNGVKRFTCDICGSKFNQKAVLLRHAAKLHHPDYTGIRNCSPEQKTKCDLCKRHFNNIDAHMLSHTNRKYECDICGKTYPKMNAMNRHRESKHFGKCYECEICKKTYLQRAKLHTHKIKVHKIKIENDTSNM